MLRYAVVRLLWLAVVWLSVSLLVFALFALVPGDPATALLGPHANEQRVAELTRALELDGSLPRRYLRWLGNALGGDLGQSYSLARPVSEVIVERIGPTLLLGGTALTLGSALGLVAAMLSARRAGSAGDFTLRGASLIGISTPTFVLAISLMLALSVGAGWFPVSGMRSPLGTTEPVVIDVLRHLALPALTLALVNGGVIARLGRRYALDAMNEDWVRVSRAQGMPESRVVHDRVFRVVLARIVPVVGLQAGFVLGGAVRTSPPSRSSRRSCAMGGRNTYLQSASRPSTSSPLTVVAACSEKPESMTESVPTISTPSGCRSAMGSRRRSENGSGPVPARGAAGGTLR